MKKTILLVLALALGLTMEVAIADFTFGIHDEIGTQAYGALVAWGLNNEGQCNVPRGNDFVAVSGGHWHSLALRADGSLVSWGIMSEAPSGNDFVAIASGSGHNLALKADGSLTAWGGTAYGKTDVPEGNDFVAIAARTEHNLALRADGSIVAWGLNNWGQCDVPEGNDFIAISAGHSHSVAQKADGSLVSWGQLTEVPAGNDFVIISAGPMHNLALRADGSLASAGGNSGNVPSGNYFVDVATGSWHCLAIKVDGSVVAWGRNLYGESDVPRALSSRIKSKVVAIAGAEGFHSLAIVAAQPAWQGFYFNDFESIVGAEWSNGKTDVTPAARPRGFLGQFGDENVKLTLSDLPTHTQATVSFDLFILRSWDGNNQIHGPDVCELKVNEGPTLLHTTFANVPPDIKDFNQAYPGDYPGGDYLPYTGAAEIKTLGYTEIPSPAPDSVYRLSYTFAHTESILRLDFSGQGLQGIQDESWGLDNVNVTISPAVDFDGAVNPADFRLIAHWKLDEGSGITAYDSAGDNHGNVYGAQWTTGQIGGALSFDGADDYVDMPWFNLTTNTVTFVAWINGWKAGNWAGIVYSRGPRGSRSASGMECGSNNTLHYTWNDNSEETWGWEGGPEIPQNQWAMVALVIESDKAAAYVYTDTGGLQVGVNNIPHMSQTVGNLKVGWDEHRDSRRFSGKIDDVRIYDRALSAAEVAELAR